MNLFENRRFWKRCYCFIAAADDGLVFYARRWLILWWLCHSRKPSGGCRFLNTRFSFVVSNFIRNSNRISESNTVHNVNKPVNER